MVANEDCISRKDAIDALWKALYEYEDKTEKQFKESDELSISEWIEHRLFVQNMSDIDRNVIQNLPPITTQPKTGWWVNEKCPRCGCRSMLGLCLEHFCPNCGLKMEYKRRRIKCQNSNIEDANL